ncbi:7-carboxy-7-deazaguanine synthase [Algimonas arctica]|nr:7-carboxy-7-deazaguanine synthase [Algimonas arctica]
MSYAVKELYLTVQGEGGQAGRVAVFLRFAGCNLWSGREQDRATAVCSFCDTDFIGTDGPGGGRFDAEGLAEAVLAAWPAGQQDRWVVCTGGEPLLQLDAALIAALKSKGFKIAIETNGTIVAPDGIDWICVSPKANAPVVQRSGQELKLVYPQKENQPDQFVDLDFENFFLQPLDDPSRQLNTDAAFQYCLAHPQWRLSVQAHKYIGVA